MAFGTERFVDRAAAGCVLARAVQALHLRRPILVLALPRGGVPVAYEVARALEAPLDVLVVRKIGMPGQPELAIGAIATGGIIVQEPASAAWVERLAIPFEQLARAEQAELERRERAYRAGLAPLDLRGQTIVLVDDGLATGATMAAAVRAARKAGAAYVVAASPLASAEAVRLVGAEADELAIVRIPPYLASIGAWYGDFEQVQDAEVRRLLRLTREQRPLNAPCATSVG
jgi:predicted phosphoribosyltransferase